MAGPMPRTCRKSSRDLYGPARSRRSTIRRAMAGPTRGRASSSRSVAVLTSIGNIGADLPTEPIRPRVPGGAILTFSVSAIVPVRAALALPERGRLRADSMAARWAASARAAPVAGGTEAPPRAARSRRSTPRARTLAPSSAMITRKPRMRRSPSVAMGTR